MLVVQVNDHHWVEIMIPASDVPLTVRFKTNRRRTPGGQSNRVVFDAPPQVKILRAELIYREPRVDGAEGGYGEPD